MKKPKKKVKKKDLIKNNVVNQLLDIGKANHREGNVKKAEEAYRYVIELSPMNFEALYLLGVLHATVGNLDDSIEFLKLSIQANPVYSLAYNDLGVVLQQKGDVTGATANFKKALELNNKLSEAQNNLGVSLQSKGAHEEAKECFKKAMLINPYYFDACNNYIFALDLSKEQTVESLIQERKDWTKIHEVPLLSKQKPHDNDLSINRKLRIGYVSADFRLHSASFVFGAMLNFYDKSNFEVYAYNNSTTKPDSRTVAFREKVTRWRDITLFSDEKVTEIIREDKIDILVDLSGFSAGSRLLTFARKPAPIQVTAWGYATSTGMQSIDYFFADEVVVPPEEKHLYTEEVIYLPNIVNHYCPERKPDVKELPALKNWYVTFGSFNRLAKVSDDSFEVWAKILKDVPNSKMLFKINEADYSSAQIRIIDKFKPLGIDFSRLLFEGRTTWNEHMEAFNRFDIALDPWPHTGGLTTIDCLVQGVPVVTLRWPTIVGRLSSSMLTSMDMTDWIAETEEEYIDIAIKKASDIEALAKTRAGLRDKFMKSILGDNEAYCKAVEQEYLKMWKRYVENHTNNS